MFTSPQTLQMYLTYLPAWGGWIEISILGMLLCFLMYLPVCGEWIEIGHRAVYSEPSGSLPARGGWIEIFRSVRGRIPGGVSLRMGRAD